MAGKTDEEFDYHLGLHYSQTYSQTSNLKFREPHEAG